MGVGRDTRLKSLLHRWKAAFSFNSGSTNVTENGEFRSTLRFLRCLVRSHGAERWACLRTPMCVKCCRLHLQVLCPRPRGWSRCVGKLVRQTDHCLIQAFTE